MAQEQFLGDPNAGGFLTEEVQVPEPFEGQLSRIRRNQDIKPSNLTDAELEATKAANEPHQETITSRPLAPQNSEDLLGVLLEQKADVRTVEDTFKKQEEVRQALMGVEEFSNIDLAMANDPRVGAELFKIEHRSNIVRERMLNMAEELEDGFAGKVLEFIDQMGYDMYTGYLNIGSELAGEGTEVSRLSDEWEVALRTMDDEEFQGFINERFEHILEDPVLNKPDQWRVIRELQALDAAGAVLWDEEFGKFQGLMSAVDIATLGVSGATVGWRAGRSSLGRLRSSTGTSATTREATGTDIVVRGGIDGQILDEQLLLDDVSRGIAGSGPGPTKPKRPFTVAENVEDAVIIDDIMPGAYSSRVKAPGSNPPPVSAGAVSKSVANNMFIRRFLDRQQKFSFGTVDLATPARAWATAKAAKMAEASSTSLIDLDIIEEGIQQVRSTMTFGKPDGMPFKNYDTAKAFADKTPNSRVIDTRTNSEVIRGNGKGEFAVVVDMRVPVREVTEATNLGDITNKSMIGRLFGRADRGSGSFSSNLADFGDYGALGYLQDFKNVTKAINKLPKRDSQAIDNILTTLRDTPNGGNARTWLTTEDFTDSFRQLTGNLPSKKAIQAYEDLVQMSDFNWYIKANERLSVLANQGATVVKTGDVEVMAFPEKVRTVGSLSRETGPIWVWDASAQRRLNVKTLKEDTPLLALQSKTKDGSTFVVNFAGKTRIPTLDDAFPYNAGGPRSNPDMTWFVGSSEGNWATLIGARSEKDANLAVKQFNTVAERLARYASDEVDLTKLTRGQRQELDDLVKANNKWNPNIEDIEDFLNFTKSRGVAANKTVGRRARGENMSKILVTPDQSLLDMNLDSYISYHRHDQALVEFGGEKAANPDPILAIQRQYNQMVHRGAQTQYRMNHPTAWNKAVERVIKEEGLDITRPNTPMTDEMLVRHLKINSDTVAARKLKQEQAVIVRRLDMLEGSQSAMIWDPAGNAMTRSAEWAAEKLHDWNPKAGNIGRYMADTFVKQGNNKLLTLGFFQRMASLDQILLQASHFIPVTAISPKNGLRGMQIATVVRQAARSGDESIWKAVYNNLRVSTGLDETEMKALMDHLMDSGRGYMRGAVAEDPNAGLTNSMLGKTRDILATPYYAGENYSATISRVVAFLDTRGSYRSLDVNSREFWNAVTARDRDLSFALNKAQKSMVQSDGFARVITQWTSYPLRTIESVLFNKGLSGAERGRLAAATTMMWGIAGLGLYQWLGAEAKEKYKGPLANILVNGADVAFDELLGVKVGDRLAFNPVELIERGVGTFSKPFETIPAFTLVGDTAKPTLSGLSNAFSGRWSLLSHDAQTLARAWKVVDAGVMGWTMFTEDARISRGGQTLEKEFTPTQEVLQAIGIKPSEATEFFRSTQVTFNQKDRRDKALKQAETPFKMAIEAAEGGEYGKALQFIKDADAIVQAYGLSETRLAEVREALFNRVGFERINYTIMQLVKDGYLEEARELQETFGGN